MIKTYPLITLFAGLFLLAACVLQVNAYTKEVYLIKGYQQEIKRLSQENKLLEIQFSSANSLTNIGSYLENQNFGKIKQAEYAKVLEGTAMAQ